MAMAISQKSLAIVVLLFCLVVASCDAKGRGRGPTLGKRNANEKIFNVLQFGAVGNGKKDNALHFIQAWKAACAWAGSARLLIPQGNFLAGPVIFQGPCKSPSPITVQFVGNVKALSDPSSYEEDFWILFEKINGLVVAGTGIIDGQGNLMWQYNNGGGSLFPSSIKFNHVTNGMIRQITSINPMGFHMSIVLSNNIKARSLHLLAPEDSPNTDGIHISQSDQVRIARSVIRTGDDCVGIIQGSTNISIRKVTCGPGHGFSIGSLGKYPDEKDVRGIVVMNCTLTNTQNGLRIKTWAGSPPSQASGMIFDNIIMDNVKNPIIIDQGYGSKSKAPSKVKISDIHYSNIRGTSSSSVGVELLCSQQVPCEKVHFSNINLKYAGAKPLPFTSTCTNARVTYAGVQFPPPCR